MSQPTTTAVEPTGMVAGTLAQRIEEVIRPPADRLVEAFFKPTGRFAGTTFDDLPDNPPDRFTSSDLVAVSLLGMQFAPRAVRALLVDQAESLGNLLAAVPQEVDLWSATDDDLNEATVLYAALRNGGAALWGVGPTARSKLLARKRPRLVPIVDTVVRNALGLSDNSWIELRAALQNPGLPEAIEAIRPPGVDPPVSTLRLLDAAVWMRHSKGRGARAVRAGVGLV